MAVSPLTETLQSAAHQTHKHNSSGGPTNTPHKTKGFEHPLSPQTPKEGRRCQQNFFFLLHVEGYNRSRSQETAGRWDLSITE